MKEEFHWCEPCPDGWRRMATASGEARCFRSYTEIFFVLQEVKRRHANDFVRAEKMADDSYYLQRYERLQ